MSVAYPNIHLSAVKVRQPIGEFYIAALNARELQKISYVDVRQMESEQDNRREVEKYLGIQRPLREDRIAEIKQYVKGLDAAFPSSVILSINEKCADWDETRQILTLKPYTADPNIPGDESIPLEKIAQILDGQHRVRGLEDWLPANGEFDLPVSIFVGADIATQAAIFATVNLTQTKVSKSLVFDLYELAETRSPQKTAHNIAVVLDSKDNSPFYHRIKRLGVATKGRENDVEPLTQATFVASVLPYISADPVKDRQILLAKKALTWPKPSESSKYIFRTLFIQNKDGEIANAIWNYFDAVRLRWPNAWANFEQGSLLPKTNGFRALMRLLRPIYWTLGKKEGEIASLDEISGVLKKADIPESDLNTKIFVPGTSGEASLYGRLKDEMNLKDRPDA